MKINKLNNYNNTFNGNLKIYRSGNQHPSISEKDAKKIEQMFAELTKGDNAHLDFIMFDRYNLNFAKPDRILYTDGEFSDYVDTFFTKHNNNNADIVNKLVSIYNGFRNIKTFKESIKTIFKG